MALSRWVVGTTVTLPNIGAPAPAVATDANGFGLVTYTGSGAAATTQWSDGPSAPMTFIAGTVLYADNAPTSTPSGAAQLFTALAAAGANLFAYRDGTDNVGHAALGN
jgi:hypothetical protein